MNSVPTGIVNELAPTGRLRAAINLSNIVLAQTDAATGDPVGVTVELARALGERLSVPVDFVRFNAAGSVFDAVKRAELDIVFLAIDPLRTADIAFTPPYALIDGNFVVAADAPLMNIADINRPGVRVSVARGSAYDLFLTRALKAATLIRPATGLEALEMFAAEKLEAAAGVKQPIVKFMSEHSGLRLIKPPFMEIKQAMGTPKNRVWGARYLHTFVEEMKESGFIADALRRSGQHDVAVAPVAS